MLVRVAVDGILDDNASELSDPGMAKPDLQWQATQTFSGRTSFKVIWPL